MKFSQFLTGTLFAATGLASPTPAKEFVKVDLAEPLDWIAGSSLFPGNIIAGYDAESDKYDSESWNNHVLAECKKFSACTSTISFSAINSGTPKERAWFGYCFRGGATTPKDYVRDHEGGVEDSTAYTIKA